MYEIVRIKGENLKCEITEEILRTLPKWFGIEESLVEYVEEVKNKNFYAIYEKDKCLGFISIKENNIYTAEIYVVGVIEAYHGKGIGKYLLETAERDLKNGGFKYLMVKTLGESHNDVNYAKTRKFYERVGFTPLEEIKEIWGEKNPCLLMVKNIEKK